MDIAFIIDPLDSLKAYKDSTVLMMREAARRGHRVHCLEPSDLRWAEGEVLADAVRIEVSANDDAWFTRGERSEGPAARFDVLMMRKDPPFDMEYVYATYLLELVEARGVAVINAPRAIRDHNEKLSIARFPQFIAPTLVTRRDVDIRAFLARHGTIVLKPLDGMGGSSVFVLAPEDRNISVVIETLTQLGTRTVMAQKYLPEIRQGDKRVLVIDGVPCPYALARIPKEGESRGNLAAGGRGVAQALSARDREIAEAVGPALKAQGLVIVGLDIIGNQLTEINVTSPTCMREILDQTGHDAGTAVLDAIEARAARA